MTVGSASSGMGAASALSDADLTAEIAPAMLDKLKADGFTKGTLLANSLVILALAVTQQLRDATFDHASLLGWGALFSAGASLGILPFFLKRKSVSNEIRYRRQHNKWRWEP